MQGPGGRAALARRGHGACEGWEGEGGTRSRRDQPQPHAPTRALNTTSQRCASTPYCKIPKRVDTHCPRGGPAWWHRRRGIEFVRQCECAQRVDHGRVLPQNTCVLTVVFGGCDLGSVYKPQSAALHGPDLSRARPELMAGSTCLSRAPPRRPEGGSSIGSWVPVGRPARARARVAIVQPRSPPVPSPASRCS